MTITKKLIEEQRKILLKEKAKLEEKIKTLKSYPDYGQAGDDNVQEVVDFENNLSIDNKMESLLKRIKKALKAIDEQTYGKCRKCGNPIESGRLKAMSYADLCVTCNNKK